MASFGDILAGGLYSIKSALGLQNVNLFPGDVNKSLTGVPASRVYGYNVPATPTSPSYPGGINYGLSSTPAQRQAVSTVKNTGGLVLGSQTSNVPSTPGGGGGGGGGGTPQQPQEQQEDPMAAIMREIDTIYSSAMSGIGAYEGAIRANQPTVEKDITGQYEATKQNLGTEKTVGERQLTQSGTEAGTAKENALAASRRLYNELQMGGQQRFGGASSAGEAYNELTGREYQRSQATTQQAYQTALSKITDLQANLNDRYESSLFSLETQKNQALNETRRSFDEKMAEIQNMKEQAGQNKSSMRLQALQDLRNQVFQINLATVQTNAALQQQKQQSELALQQAMAYNEQLASGGQGAVNTMLNQTTTSPTSAYSVSGGATNTTPTYTGITTPAKKEELSLLSPLAPIF